MSFQAMTWAIDLKCKSPGQKLVLLMLANHTNSHTGQCNPSHRLLANECSMGISTLKNHLRDLAEIGYITITGECRDGVSMPNHYRLNFDGVGQNLTGGPSGSGGGGGQNLATNQEVKPGIEPKSISVGKPGKFDPLSFLLMAGVDQQSAEDWLQVRKEKGTPSTMSAIEKIFKAFDAASMTVADGVKLCAENAWAGFNKSWLNSPQARQQQPKQQQPQSAWQQKQSQQQDLINRIRGGSNANKIIDLN
jgi:hypothetical protein